MIAKNYAPALLDICLEVFVIDCHFSPPQHSAFGESYVSIVDLEFQRGAVSDTQPDLRLRWRKVLRLAFFHKYGCRLCGVIYPVLNGAIVNRRFDLCHERLALRNSCRLRRRWRRSLPVCRLIWLRGSRRARLRRRRLRWSRLRWSRLRRRIGLRLLRSWFVARAIQLLYQREHYDDNEQRYAACDDYSGPACARGRWTKGHRLAAAGTRFGRLAHLMLYEYGLPRALICLRLLWMLRLCAGAGGLLLVKGERLIFVHAHLFGVSADE